MTNHATESRGTASATRPAPASLTVERGRVDTQIAGERGEGDIFKINMLRSHCTSIIKRMSGARGGRLMTIAWACAHGRRPPLGREAGNDTLGGEDDRDFLSNGTGNDSLYGGDGNDRLVGSAEGGAF